MAHAKPQNGPKHSLQRRTYTVAAVDAFAARAIPKPPAAPMAGAPRTVMSLITATARTAADYASYRAFRSCSGLPTALREVYVTKPAYFTIVGHEQGGRSLVRGPTPREKRTPLHQH